MTGLRGVGKDDTLVGPAAKPLDASIDGQGFY